MKQTFKFLTSDTMSRVSNDCRPTLGRLSTLFLLLFALSFGFNQQVKATNYTVYFSPQLCGKSWSTPYVYYNRGWNESGYIKMTATGNTFHGYDVYSATVTDHESSGNFDQVSFCKGNNDWTGGQIDIRTSWGSIQSGKIWTANNTSDNYTPDTQFTLYFVKSSSESSWTTPWVNVKRGYNHWANVEMASTGKTYNGSTIYSATIPAQGFDQIEFHKSENNYDNKVTAASSWTTSVNEKIYTKVSSSWAWRDYNYDVTLTFKNGTTTVDTKSTLKGGSITAPSAPSKTGYTFQGWGTSKVAAGGTISNVQADATYDAQWTANTNTPYTVKHYKQNLDGTYPSTATETENLTGTTDASVTPAVKSYTGFTAPSTQTKTIAADGSLVVTYQYTRNSYTLAWAGLDGATVTGGTPAGSVKFGAALTAPTVNKDGYNFTGWTPEVPATMPAANSTYTAQWAEASKCAVTYSKNTTADVSNMPTDDTQYLPNATVTVSSTTPSCSGYTFMGWNEAADGTGTSHAAGSQFTITSNVTLFAQWQVVTYTITYNGLEGATHANPATYTVEDAFEFTAPSAREGYTFTGWSPASITKGTTGNKTITASWTLNHHTLTWNLDGGSITTSGTPAGEVDYGTTLVAPVVEKTGYTFAGWSPSVAATMPDNNVTYTATWTENKTAVTVSSNNTTWGTVSPTSANVGVTTSATLKATPKTGYKFVSWALTGGATSTSTLTNTTITIKGDGSSATGTAVATFAEDLTANWYIRGDKNLLTKCSTGWEKIEAYRFSKPNKDASSAYIDIEITQEQVGHTYEFKLQDCGVSGEPMYGWGTNDGDFHTFTQTETFGIYYNEGRDHNLKITPSIKGTYRFSIDWSSGHNLTVTFPTINAVTASWNSWTQESNATVTEGVLTYELQVTDAQLTEKDLAFKIIYGGVYYGATESGHSITATNHSDWDLTSTNSNNIGFKPSIAGTYTFEFNGSTNKLNVTYPVPVTPASITVTKERYYGEDKINTFIATDPYSVYTDELIKLTIDEVAAPTGCTTYYQFGDNAASTERTYTISNITTTASSIEAKVFFRPNSGGKDGDATTETINYQGVATPTLYLTTSWSNDEAQEGSDVPDNVTIYYSTADYSGPAIVTRSKDGAEEETFFTVPDGTKQMNQTYNLPDKNVQRQTFVATATANSRTFTATKAVSIYRLVEIVITDEDHLMNHYYMWENGTNPLHEEAAWPGDIFFSTLGNAHIFYVKYPSYTDFVLNNGKASTEDGAAQTINVTVPDRSTCYTIGEKITTEGDDKGKYAVQVAGECPNKLYVGNIPEVSAVQGEGVMVSPQVDIDPLLDANNLTISFNYGTTKGITCDQRGRSFMVTATAGTGTYHISVTYSIEGADPVTKDVTIKVTSAIMIQAKIGELGWNESGNHDNVWLHYWMSDGSTGDVLMSWKDYVNYQDRYYARIPLGSDGKVNFMIGYPNNGEYWGENWRMSNDVTNVTASGCYTISDGGEEQKRSITRDGDNCWTLYYVEIDMANGTVYRSNTVEDLNNVVSFFAPGSSEPQAKSGLVRIICNGSQTVTVSAATFTKSGIYTAKITANGEGLSDVAPYTGDYYIRTDAAEGGWNDYVKDSHKFTYFTPYNGALYDYYWVMNKKLANAGDKLNIKGCVGNGINENLANMIEVSNYTDGYGDIIPDAGTGVNLRFGYNPETNYFERSILRGSTQGESDFLNLIGANIYNNKSCTQELNEANYTDHADWSKFSDISDWVYEKNIYVKIEGSHSSAQALLKSKAFNGTTIYQLGYTLDDFGRQTGTPAQRDILHQGTTIGTYNIRVIYDFKTNRIVSAWSPIEDITFSTPTVIDADVLFVRHENDTAAQVILSTNSAEVSSLQFAYFVMEIDGSSDKTSESMYWFSVPFDCEISSIFGVEGYVTLDDNGSPTAGTWGIQTYDGKSRAEKGWYIEDTQTFWRWMNKSEKLLKGNGYLLVFDRADADSKGLWQNITREEPCEGTDDGCVDGKKTVTTTVLRLYFPSKVSGWEMTRSGEDQWVDYDDWTCTKPNRKAQDSNWRLLGTNSYSNIRIDKETQFERTEKDSVLDKAPNFIYEYHPEKAKYDRYVAASSLNRDFLSFNCYMVQFSGRINWNQYTQSEHDQSSVAARRVVAEDELTNAQMTLSLKKGNNTEDNTYIYMDARATTDFDNQMDLTKITDTRANHIYSVINEVEYAGNTLPVEDQIVPLTVNVNANGAYTFAMPEMTDGLEVYLMDNATNAHIDMAIDSYTVDLNKGKIADRFYLDVRVKERTTPTIIETIGSDGNPTGDRFIKVIQNDQLHIIRNGRIYNASGMELNK